MRRLFEKKNGDCPRDCGQARAICVAQESTAAMSSGRFSRTGIGVAGVEIGVGVAGCGCGVGLGGAGSGSGSEMETEVAGAASGAGGATISVGVGVALGGATLVAGAGAGDDGLRIAYSPAQRPAVSTAPITTAPSRN